MEHLYNNFGTQRGRMFSGIEPLATRVVLKHLPTPYAFEFRGLEAFKVREAPIVFRHRRRSSVGLCRIGIAASKSLLQLRRIGAVAIDYGNCRNLMAPDQIKNRGAPGPRRKVPVDPQRKAQAQIGLSDLEEVLVANLPVFGKFFGG